MYIDQIVREVFELDDFNQWFAENFREPFYDHQDIDGNSIFDSKINEFEREIVIFLKLYDYFRDQFEYYYGTWESAEHSKEWRDCRRHELEKFLKIIVSKMIGHEDRVNDVLGGTVA